MLSNPSQATRLVILGLSCLQYLFSMELCPTVCNPCLEHLISCTSGGLYEIPKDLKMDTKKVTLIGHTFSQSTLTRQNFSRFSKPKYSIEQLSIRQSNIQRILSETFFDLSGLDTLDLSGNVKLIIEEKAFANLKLKYLNLNEIGTLNLSQNAFDDLLVVSLSIKNSNLRTFPYSLLKPLAKDLRKLFLSKNNIQSLSSKFESLFRQLTVLDLHDNPLMCSCSLLWLSTTLRWRQRYYKAQMNSLSDVPNPSCAGPPYLQDEHIDRVPDSEFDCQPPMLDRIEVLFQSADTANLRCVATMQARRAPMNISWNYVSGGGLFYPRRIQSVSQYEAAVAVSRMSTLDRFVCSMYSDAGNNSVQFNLQWPMTKKIKTSLNVTNYRQPFKPITTDTNSNYQSSFFFKEQYSLLELLASVIGTFIVTMLLFIVLYRFYFFKAIKRKKEQMKKAGYSAYEVGIYSDSQTYDIPQYPSFDRREEIFQPNSTMPYSDTPTLNYTNHRKLML